MLSKKKVTVIGAGKMGETLISSLLEAEIVDKGNIVATARHQERLDIIGKKYGVQTSTNNAEAVSAAHVILICVKPQAIANVLTDLSGKLKKGQLLSRSS